MRFARRGTRCDESHPTERTLRVGRARRKWCPTPLTEGVHLTRYLADAALLRRISKVTSKACPTNSSHAIQGCFVPA